MRTQVAVAANNEPFWIADGIANNAELLIGGQPMFDVSNVVVANVYQNNWQGNIALATYPRVNQLKYSQDFTQSAWSKVAGGTGTAPVVTANYASAPDGSTTADRVVFSRGGGTTINDLSQLEQVMVTVANAQYSQGIWMRSTDGASTYQLALSYGGQNSVLCTITGTWQWFENIAIASDAARSFRLGTMQTTGSASADVLLWGGNRCPQQQRARIYIPTLGSAVTQTDYSVQDDEITWGYLPNQGASFTWSGSADVMQLDMTPVTLAQYANSPIIDALLDYMNQWIDPAVDVDNFYNYVWNVYTAQGFGLDIWGRIVGAPRTIVLSDPLLYFGFNEGNPSWYPFNNEPFYNGPVHGQQYTLNDDSFRLFILTKALANISNFTAPNINALLSFMFPNRGSCYVLETGSMQLQYKFNFTLQPWELSVLAQPALMPRPAGVGITIVHP